MGFVEKVTDLIVGRQQSTQHEIRRLEKHYEGLEQKLLNSKTVTFETAPGVENTRKDSFSRTESLPARLPKEGSLRTGRPILHRSQSEVPAPLRKTLPSPSGPPDITAYDLSEEQLKRAYSHDNIWDADNPLPPFPRMIGFGRYRRAADAPADLAIKRLHDGFPGLDGNPVVEKIGAFKLADMPPESLIKYREESSVRSNSFASTKSSLSGSSDYPPEEKVDILTGTRISRGFGSSNASSAASSFREGYSNFRKSSSLSMTSISAEGDQNPIKIPRRKSALSALDSHASGQLRTIDEGNDHMGKTNRKIGKPCLFDASEDSENAPVFDDSDDNDEWHDIPNVRQGTPRSSVLTEQLKKAQTTFPAFIAEPAVLSNPTSKPVIDRSKTIKPSVRPALGRTHSRKGKPQLKRAITAETTLPRRPTTRRANSHLSKMETTEGSKDGLKETTIEKTSSSETELQMAEPKHQIRSIPIANIVGQGAIVEDDKLSNRSNSSEELTILPTQAETKPIPMPGHRRRQRSGTAIHIFSGNVQQETRPISEEPADKW